MRSNVHNSCKEGVVKYLVALAAHTWGADKSKAQYSFLAWVIDGGKYQSVSGENTLDLCLIDLHVELCFVLSQVYELCTPYASPEEA